MFDAIYGAMYRVNTALFERQRIRRCAILV
jgi:hypothetical protein